MVFELRQDLKLSQQLVMTPQLQQAIKLLQLSRQELIEAIQQELVENPALEEKSDSDSNETEERTNNEADAEKDIELSEEIFPKETDWENYIEEFNTPGRMNFDQETKQAPKYEAFISKKETLEDHLLWQFKMLGPTEEEERIASAVIGNLDADGYLKINVEEIAEISETDIEDAEYILETMLQTLDPPGVCARSLSESLLNQLKYRGIENRELEDLIKFHLDDLGHNRIKNIARDLHITTELVMEYVEIIRTLEPKPGRAFYDETANYITPDIYVYKEKDDFIIVLNDDGFPNLHINPFYKKAIETERDKVDKDTKSYLRERIRSASGLIKSIYQRQRTIYRVTESILKRQRDFFEKGIAFLKPMVLNDIAEDLEMHTSTISRVTTNKYVFTPQGMYELKFFFNSSISRKGGDSIASVSVHDKIKKIIEEENPKKPLSDEKISKILKSEGIKIARRTVAKYREVMRILPSSKRKQY
ncbi:MAG: RNA polymerase sigma-54 factor [Deltaproteobacteria bacterium]|nr:MAG: RNA polymerase sigma-54 factor [Deltaproteobacteria bacterium]PIE74940.1 MAG: RNA polymerase sigma-54 factor [Deltaproteobacteria bacterium]